MAEDKKKPGRPEKPKAERRIKPSGEGRLTFKQGEFHTLDVQFGEARAVGQQLKTQRRDTCKIGHRENE